MQPPRSCHDIQTDSVRHPDIHTRTHTCHKTCRSMCDAPLIWSCTFRQVSYSSYLVPDILRFVPGIVVVWGTDIKKEYCIKGVDHIPDGCCSVHTKLYPRLHANLIRGHTLRTIIALTLALLMSML